MAASISSIRLARSAISVSREVVDLFLGRDRRGARLVGLGLGLAFLAALVLDRDLLLLPGDLDRLRLGDPGLLDDPAGLDLGAVHLLLGHDARFLGLALANGLLLGDFGNLCGAPDLDVALLFEPREFGLARYVQAASFGFEILRLDLHPGFLLDVVARLPAQLDLLGELGQALRVERVVGVEMLDRGLVEAGQRHRFELEAVHRQVGRRDLLHLLDEIGALLVQLRHRHAGGDRAQRVDELALDQLLQLLRMHRPQAERLRGDGDAFAVGPDADIEFRLHVDPQSVEGDQGVDILALDGEAERC